MKITTILEIIHNQMFDGINYQIYLITFKCTATAEMEIKLSYATKSRGQQTKFPVVWNSAVDGNEWPVAVLTPSIIMENFLVDPFRISILGTLLHIAPSL